MTASAPTGTARLAIFARAPVLGRVKTRLAKDIGAEAALAAYRQLVARTLAKLAPGSGDFRPEIWVAGDNAEVAVWRRRFPVLAQPNGDLGERMAAAFEAGVELLVGCDIPMLTAAYVARAQEALADADLVLGPTEDGGYCLIAMRESYPQLFADIPWSTGEVLKSTLRAAEGLTVTLLEKLWDVDDGADFQRYRETLVAEQLGEK